MMKASAAILWNDQKNMSIEDVEIESPRPDELLVKVVACGICHTDMVMRDKHLPVPQPVVLGHEGSGVVAAVGSNITRFKVGDRVAMTFNSCGHCASCNDHEPAYCHAFFPLNFFGARQDGTTSLRQGDTVIHSHIFGQSAFASYVVCHERNTVIVPDAMPLELAGPFGCGFQTGAGAVLNALQVKPGSSVVILGGGAVGLSAVMAAKIVGASTIVTADIKPDRLELAKTIGATATIDTKEMDFSESVAALLPAGVDYIVDTTGYIPLIEQAMLTLAPRGVLGLVGAFAPGMSITLDPSFMLSGGRSVVGIVEGSSLPEALIPQLMRYYLQGKFPIDKLVKYYEFEDINEAIADGESGKVIKPILRMTKY